MDWLSSIRGMFEFVLPFLDCLPAVRAILGSIFVFFLPGFAWTLVFFRGRQINLIERFVLSFGLSIAIVTLSLLALNRLIGLRLTGVNSILVTIVVTVIPVALYYLNRLIRRRRQSGG